MRATLVYDADGRILSATILRGGTDAPADISHVLGPHQRASEVDITQLVEGERAHAKSEQEAIGRALSRLMMSGGRTD